MEDTRNLVDKYKGWPIEDIVADLDKHGSLLEIAIENLDRDYNMGTIVRSANAFGVRHIHVVGRRQWNKRGAMATDKYLHVHYYETVDEFIVNMNSQGKTIIAIDNIEGSIDLNETKLPKNTVLVFGAEGPGISQQLAENADLTVAIEQLGSTRSLNVGVAAGIAMYAWTRQNILDKNKQK